MTVREIARTVIGHLETHGVDYVLVGGIAAIHHGLPRFTKDADFVVAVSSERLDNLLAGLPENFRVDPQARMELFTGTMRWVVAIFGTPYLVEFFLLGNDLHHAEEFRRRQRVWLPLVEAEVWTATAEDIVIQKLRWFRNKDKQDIEAILGLQSETLDFPYIERWCDQHGTRARLDEMRESIPPPEEP